jgi:hypothetical protein
MRQEYVATLDLQITEVERRFNQPSIKQMANIEQLLFATIRTQKDISELDVAAQMIAAALIYADVDQAKLKYQLYNCCQTS